MVLNVQKPSVFCDIIETFQNLRRINIKLNPAKRTFEVEDGWFFGHIIDATRIRANPNKIQAVLDTAPPKDLRELQRLNEKLVALNRFLSRASEKQLPFLKVLIECNKKKVYEWTEEAEVAFQDLKVLLNELPTLTALIPGETLTMYLVMRNYLVPF